MYPFLRLSAELLRARRLPPLGLWEVHVSHHRCLPWDLDPWNELNNGRTLTLYDLGRVPFGRRLGLDRALAEQGWGMTVAGVSVRYRRRVQMFDRLEMRCRVLGWDRRFLYMEQTLWKAGDCANAMLLRSAVIGRRGAGGPRIVAPSSLIAALGHPAESPPLPDWVTHWAEAEGARPWPPARG